MWKARAPAETEMSCQKCKVQGMSQNRTLPQGMPVREKRQKSQSCPDTTPRMKMTPTLMKMESDSQIHPG